ncbi:filamentous hemagglutinin N-terminal domain-containing protein [Helicobacter pullorum NCTC 12824]|uniref:filamentous hemagglutinin N-terminal domain-containing protein n=1 Tax=Helicobacter pullorum TaxID=35818 RepID=UPI00124894CA|nr:filamentous hemagglutinin N-terminal domain-containing protein [Helicobacter pullorum]KAB0574921.1 filamentous hemagglutinin N-terminal domain-containing protein [Helicobacter pullorum NCTC 12824]
MNITGNNTNHIIAWGGGFNINKGESVNFNTSHKQQASFLNLDYSNKASQILGNLNGNGNNIYLVNPSGVLIGQNANINANKFIASTSALSELELNQFKANGTTNGASFSPVYKPNKGNVVNLGHIKANEGITLIGNTVDIRGGKLENKGGNSNTSIDNSIQITGDKVYIDMSAIDSGGKDIYATAFKEGYIQMQMNKYYENGYNFISDSGKLQTNGKIFKKAITIGNMGNSKANVEEWFYFANALNTGVFDPNGGNPNFDFGGGYDEFRLVGDIDFSDVKNYANHTIVNSQGKTLIGSMIVGGEHFINGKNIATQLWANFDGNGHTLSNVTMKTDSTNRGYTGIFGWVNSGYFGNFNVNGVTIDTEGSVGGVIAHVENQTSISDIVVSDMNINAVNNGIDRVAGFVASDGGGATYNNISLDKVTIKANGGHYYIGGFATNISSAKSFNNISIKDIKIDVINTSSYSSMEIGGFGNIKGGGGTFSNIILEGYIDIAVKRSNSSGGNDYIKIGGFAGIVGGSYQKNLTLDKIDLKNSNITIMVSGSTGDIAVGGFVGHIGSSSSSGNISNIALGNIESIKIANENGTSYAGGFVGFINGSQKGSIDISNIVLEDIGEIKITGGNAKNANYAGGFVGHIGVQTNNQNLGSVKISNVVVKNIGIIETAISGNTSTLSSMNNVYAGGFAGYINGTNGSIDVSNIVLEDIVKIASSSFDKDPMYSLEVMAGGFAGYINNGTFSNITLSNIGEVVVDASIKNGNQVGHGTNRIFAGGFVGGIENSTIDSVVLNDISKISTNGVNNVRMNVTQHLNDIASGGFAGSINKSNIGNVVLNNIKEVVSTGKKESNAYINAYSGGFVGDSADSTFNNIYLYFNPDATIIANGTNLANVSVGKFYGNINNGIAFNNVHIYYNANPDSSLANPIKDADSSNSAFYNQTINPTTPETNKINLYTYTDSTQGIKDFQTALEQQNNLGGAFESNNIKYTQDSSGNYYYYFTNTTGANVTPPSIIPPSIDTDPSLPNIDLGNVVLEGSDFSVSILQEIINDILNGKYGINIDNREVLSNLAESLNNANTLQDYFNAINSYLISSSLDESTKESIRQSMDFLVAFYGENGLGNKFKGDTNYKDFYDKSFYISTSLKDLGNFISGDLNGRLDSMIKNIQILESLKQRIKAAQKYYQEALEAKLPYETLEGIYNGMVKTINESYIQALGVLETLKGEDRDYLTRLYKEYSIKEDSGFDDIRGTFSFSGNDILSKIDSIILEDKPALTPPTKEEVGDDPTKENNPDVPNNLQKIADLASKEAILILPAQEKQEAIVEDGKERGRLCIVSDNAKTNNPCMAITY